MISTELPTVTSISSWYGSNRMLAPMVAEELEGCPWVGVPFAGGMSELVHIKARTMQINDLHRHVINLARVMADRGLSMQLYRTLRREVFHPMSLAKAQGICIGYERAADDQPNLEWAVAYFVASWMPRHGSSGTAREFSTGLSTRWSADGGDSAAHYWSAVKSIPAWRRILQRANFSTLDVFDFLSVCKDQPKIGIYCDPPFPGPGDKYAHKFSEDEHRKLASRLSEFKQARVVCRFYDVPLIRELYPDSHWTWRHLVGRKQTNDAAAEVLLINGESYAKGAA